MANIRGKAGRYTGEETARLRRRVLLLAFIMVGVLGAGEGVTLSSLWARLNPPSWLTTVMQWGGFLAIGVMAWWGFRKMDELDSERIKWQRGDEGETAVGKILASLSDDYEVINDIKIPGRNANLDHVVVGPTGVFVLDAKNWRGVVQADGRGELLLNGKRTDKDEIRLFTKRIMAVREKVCALAPGTSAFFKGIYVFTAARVDAKWRTTGAVDCMTEETLQAYIENRDYGQGLKPVEVKKIADAFWKVAKMDPEFTDKATEVIGHKPVPVNVEQPVEASS